MLKLTYLESSLHMEWLPISVAEFIAERKIFATRIAQSIHIELGYASILLAVDPVQLASLQLAIAYFNSPNVSLGNADCDYLEVSFCGTWISSNPNSEVVSGIFATNLGDRLEQSLYNLWLQSQNQLIFS
ncbi:hypothetical protein Syn7502_02901 [Synechococcus sp. PCC 7502]|uniref:alr0857 family protein n=1 Tax=Synechococcus sp. PCC 7502 TaxID=1173263 RepID=UPI00029FD4E8|nr:alr0857 family protein [Synechococcus sp. PCC 7502]AFY74829.1 hypothetical protein Syn7502_02901 [Synechococcus sp. PCC 7502]